MKNKIKTHKELYLAIVNEIPKVRISSQEQKSLTKTNDTGISVIVVTSPSSSVSGDYADEVKSKKVTYISVRSNHRKRSKCIIENCLKNLGIDFEEDKTPNLGSMGGYKIKLNDKDIKIVFKFKNGYDTKDFKGWNEQLDLMFSKKPELKRTPYDRNERKQLEQLNASIGSLPITLKIGNKTFKNVIGLVGGKNGKKSDFVVIDTDGNEVCWISYKSGKTATSFQQYSGITQSKLKNNSEVKQFEQNIKAIYEDKENLFKDTTFWKPIKDNKLKKQSVFGDDFGGRPGENNVNFFVQGDLEIVERGNFHYLKSKYGGNRGLIVRNGDISKLRGNYEPTLGTRPSGDRNYIRLVKKTRGGIWPKKYISSGRKNKKINDDGSIDEK